MHKREIQEAFSQLHASEELVKEVIALKSEKKNDSRAWRMVARAAVCVAAVVAIVVTAVLWPRDEEPGEQMGMPTVGTTAAPTQLPTTLPDVPTAPTESQGYELVKMSGVLKVYACDKENVSEEELKKYELTDAVDSHVGIYVPHSAVGGKGISLFFQLPEDYFGEAEITFTVMTEYGGFLNFETREERKSKVTIENGTTIWWRAGKLSQVEEIADENKRFYADVIIYANGLVVGYGVIDFVYFYEGEYACPSFLASRFTTVCFPLVDGEFQEVTEEYVWEQIAEYKKMKAELKGV